MRRTIGATVAVVALLLEVLGIGIARAAADVTVTATVSEHPDNGHGTPPHWATDSFTRTMRIRETSLGHYSLQTTDSGTFATIVGAGRPAGHGGTISRIVTGKFSSIGTGHADGSLVGNPATFSGRHFDDVHGTPFPGSGSWANLFFDSGATVSPFDSYSFTYADADETWIDASTNNDGQDPSAGDITGKLSSHLVINPCHGKTATSWKVTNARGDRYRTFTYWSYYKGQRSTGLKATVQPEATTILHTATSTTFGIHYYNGYGISKWIWGHC